MDIKSLKDVSYIDSSFGLVRTNPLITGNVKFTIDSKNKMWLNTIDANNILAQDMFKKFPINLTRSYPSNIKTFFNQKNISTDVIYDVFKGVDPSKVSHDYKDQYDFSFYFAGAKYLNSVQYTEKFSYFAPLYVNSCDIPEYFVIFKIPGALNGNIKTLDDDKQVKYSNQEYLYDMMKTSSIIKTYSMKPGTTIGDYIRNKMFKDSLFPTEPLNVNFNKDTQTIWYGASVKSGVYCGIGEYLYDFYREEHTLKDFEYYMTCGYKRNGLLYPNIINMEFLFDDETSDVFDHNRYFGLYINSSDIERFGINFDLLKSNQEKYGNSPKIYSKIDEFGKKSTVINNKYGCTVEGELLFDNSVITNNDLNIDKNNVHVCYMKDKYDSLHSIGISNEDNKIKKINFIEKTINLKNFSGSNEIVDISGTGFVPLKNGRSSIMIHFDSIPTNGDYLKIYHKGGSIVDGNCRCDIVYFNSGFTEDSLYGKVGEYYTNIQNYDLVSLGDNSFENYYSVGISGIRNDMDKFNRSLVSCINEFPLKSFSVFYNNGDVIFVINSEYSKDGDISIKIELSEVNYSYFGCYSEDTGTISSTGATDMNNVLIIPNDFEKRIVDNFNGERDYLIRTNSGYSKIAKVIHYSSYLDKGQTQEDLESAYDIYKNYIGLVLEKKEVPVLSASKFDITKVYRPYIGMCSFYKVKDFDFDYYSTEYSKIPYEEYEGKFFVLPGTDLIHCTVYVVANGIINFRGVTFSERDIFVAFGEDDMKFSVESGDAFVIPIAKYFADSSDGYSRIYENIKLKSEDGETVGISVTYIKTNLFGLEIDGSKWAEDDYIEKLRSIIPENYQSLIQPGIPVFKSGVLDDSKDFILFNGFSSILSIDSSENKESIAYIFRDRFLNKTGSCEYDFNKENDNPEYAYFSNTVGYSCKFSYINLSDVRNNPYRLNTSQIFGKTNISPTSDNTNIDSNLFSNEWFYIVNDIKSDSFINQKVFDLDEISGEIKLNPDFGISNLISYNSESGKNVYRYSDILYSSVAKSCRTFFRGGLLNFDETDRSGVIIPNSKKYDGYKFTSILQAFPEKYDACGRSLKPPFEFVVIADDDKKLIVFGIILYLGCSVDSKYYMTPIEYEGGVRYEQSYILDVRNDVYNNYKKAISAYGGDYRFLLNEKTGYISNITYSDFYMYKSKKYDTGNHSFSHINIPQPSTYLYSNKTIVKNNDIYNIPGFKEYTNTFGYTSEMSKTFGNILTFRTRKIENLDERVGIFNTGKTASIDYITDDKIGLSNKVIFKNQYNSLIGDNNKDMYDIRQLFGGGFYYDRIFKNITLCGIKNLFKKNTFVQYKSNFLSVSFLEDSIITKEYTLKTKTINNGKIIGYETYSDKLTSPYIMHRMHGQYMPTFRDVFYFKKDNTGTHNGVFSPDVLDFGRIKNFGYLKISDKNSNIFKYENSAIYDLKYPYIGECTVDHGDINIMLSSWDVDFHKKYTTNTSYNGVYGTMRREEDDTYINNLIILPNEIELSKFDVDILDDISLVEPSNYQVVYNSNFKTNGIINGFISIEDVVIKKLIDLGIEKSFDLIKVDGNQKKYTESEIDDYIKSYIKINILPLYEIKYITTYFRVNNSVDTFSVSKEDYNDYIHNIKLNRDVKINKTGDKFKVDFSLPIKYDKNIELFFDIKLNLI